MKLNRSGWKPPAVTRKDDSESFRIDRKLENPIKTNYFEISADAPRSAPAAKRENNNLEIHETADNLNNAMACIIGNISLAKMELKGGSTAVKYLNEAEKACSQTIVLASQLIRISQEA